MKIKNETKIGLMISVVIILLAVLTFRAGNFHFSRQGYSVKVQFQNIDGVDLNSPVMFNGFELGIVKGIAIKDDGEQPKMELTLWLKKEAQLREGAKARIKNLGFMGEKYVGLTAGDRNKAHLSPGSVIVGEEPPDFDLLVAEGQEIATEIKEISQNINERLRTNKENIDGVMSNMNATTKNMASITDNVDKRLKVSERSIDEIITNLNAVSLNLEELTNDLKLHPWKLLYRGKEQKGRQKK